MPLSIEEWGEFLRDDQQQQAKSSLLGDLMNPEVAAKTLQNSAQRGIPFALNTAAPEDFNKESMINRAQQVANDDPIVQRYLSNNDFAPHVSHDDLENLSIYGKSLKAITSGWAGGRALSKFGAASALPIAQRETELPPEAEKFWKENEEAKKNIPEGGWYHTLAGFSQFLGQVVEGTQEINRKYPMKTPETMGDVLRAGVEFPGRALSMIPAAIMTPMNLARDTGNEIYVRHQKEAAASGLPFDADATAAAATIGAIATLTALKVAPGREAEGFVKELAAAALENATVKRGLSYYMRETVKSGAIFGAAGVGQTLIQTYAEDIAREISSPEFKTIMNDPQKRAELRDNLIEAAAGGFALGAVMHLPHVGVSYLNDRRLINEARADKQNYDAVQRDALSTQTYERSPEAFKAFTEEAARGHEIGIPADAIVEAFGEKALDKFSFVSDFETKLQGAYERGGDVKIPLKDWLVALKDNPELGQAFKDDLRIRPEGLTMREADALKEAKLEDYQDTDFAQAETIRGAAYTVGGKTYVGPNHIAAMDAAVKDLGLSGYDELIDRQPGEGLTQKLAAHRESGDGFITSTGRVVTRKEARVIAEASGQGKGTGERGIKAEDMTGLSSVPEGWESAEGPTLRELPKPLEEGGGSIYAGENDAVPTKLTFLASDIFHSLDTSYFTREARILADFFRDKFDRLVGDMEIRLVADEDMTRAVEGLTNRKGSDAEGTNGFYQRYQGQHYIAIRESTLRGADSAYVTRLVLHEAAHAISIREMAANPELRATAQLLMKDTKEWLQENDPELHDQHSYAWTNEKEFVAEAFSNPQFQRLLSLTPVSEDIARFLKLDHKTTTMWDAVKALVKQAIEKVLGIRPDDTVMDALLKLGERFEEVSVQKKDRLSRANEVAAASPEEAAFSEAGKAAKKELWLRPLFKDAASAGMTEQEFARYSKKLEAEATDARDKAVKQAAKAIEKRETAEWKENERRVRDEVALDLSYRPDVMADTFFRTGKYPGVERMKGFKLDADLIRERYGEHTLGALDPSTVTKSGGIDPDDAAGLFGFRSGDGLVNGLTKIRRDRGEVKPGEFLKGLIDRETAERMEHQYGVLSENILEKAREDVGTGGQADLLADELHYLQTLLTKREDGETNPARQITAELIAERAKEATKKAFAKDVANIGEITRDVGRAGRQAELALLKGDIQAAFQAKQRQAISLPLLREAKAFKREYDAAQRRIERFSSNPVVAGVDQGYTDQIHSLLNIVGENIPRTEENLTRALDGQKIDDFINQKGEDGRIIPPLNLPPRKALNEFTAEEFHDFAQTLQSLEANGRAEKQIEIAGKIFDYETAVAQGLQNLDSMKGSFDPRNMKGFRHTARKLDASMLKMEQLFDWVDKNDPNGVFNRLVFRPLSEAEHWKLDKLAELSKDFKGLPKGRARRLDLDREVQNEILLDPKEQTPMKLTRRNMIKMALDWGNASNREKLLKGWRWEEQDVTNFFNQNMKKEDWDYVQKIFDITAKLGPDIQRVTKALSGVETDLIEPKEIVTPFGTYRGGYTPLIEDRLSRINREKTDTDIFGGAMFQLLPTTQAVKRRTGKMYPLSLEPDDIPSVIADTIHYLAFAEPMANARKFLGDTLIREGISKAFGPEYTEQLNPWLKYIATNGGEAAYRHLDWWNKLSRESRMNVQTALVGFNLGTTAIHDVSAFANSMTEVGTKYLKEFLKAVPTANKDHLAANIDSFFRNPQNAARMTDFVNENSGEVRNRKLKIDNNMQAQWQASIGKSSVRAAFQQYSMSLLAHFDLMSAIPTWYAVYTGKMREGFEHSDAVYAADKAIRNAHGASGITDLAAVQRGPEFMKWMTMFMGYFVHNYSRNRDTVRIMTGKSDLDGWGKWGTVAGRSIGYILVPAVMHEAIRGHQDKNSDWGTWAADALVGQLGGGIPFLRDLIHIASSGQGAKNPMESAMDGFIAPLRDATHLLTGHKVSDQWVKHTLAFPGWTLGLSSNFVAQEGQYLWDLHTGKQQVPQTFKEWINGILHGKTKPK